VGEETQILIPLELTDFSQSERTET